MRDLRVHVAEAVIRDNFRSAEILELGGIRAGFGSEVDELEGAFKAAVVVGGDVGYEPGGVLISNQGVSNFKFHVFSPQEVSESSFIRRPESKSACRALKPSDTPGRDLPRAAWSLLVFMLRLSERRVGRSESRAEIG